jgi:hypothetical protein
MRLLAVVSAICALISLNGCDPVENSPGSPEGTLCFDYPLGLEAASPFACSAAGCHYQPADPDAPPGTSGGALRITPGQSSVDLNILTADQVRQTAIHRTFLSVKGAANINSPRQSNLLRKPLVEVSHGGGRIFVSDQDSAARQLLFWVTNPAPVGGDEFSAQCANLFAAGNLCQPF